MQRDKRRLHPSRDVTDESLASSIELGWNQERLARSLKLLIEQGEAFGLGDFSKPEVILAQLLALESQVIGLGDGGILLFNPVAPGLSALVHILIWDPLYMRRPELLRAAARYVFRTWSLERVTAVAPTSNILACRLAKSVGFKQEGVSRNALRYNGEMTDLALFGLLKDEV